MQRLLTNSLLLLFAANCGGTGDQNLGADASPNAVDADVPMVDAATGDPITVERLFDEPSQTYYYLTRIRHTDNEGKLLKLRHAQATAENGETIPEFAERIGDPLVAINASLGQSGLPDGVRKPIGIQIVDGEIIQEQFRSNRYVLGIKADNELLAYPAETTAQAILADGSNDALSAFIPLIENHDPVSDEILQVTAGLTEKHPRQAIAQFDNLDLLILSCGGRGIDGEGMSADVDLVRIFTALDVKFAFNLDGGGSVATMVNGELITKVIDGNGTEARPRPNFLYVK